jgi:hypothetical protein
LWSKTQDTISFLSEAMSLVETQKLEMGTLVLVLEFISFFKEPFLSLNVVILGLFIGNTG